MIVVENKKTKTRHLSDDGYKTFCGLSARRMQEVKPPPASFSSWEEEERWQLNACMCARCRRTERYNYFVM